MINSTLKPDTKRDKDQKKKPVVLVDEMPLRPAYGTQGRPILLMANYFELATPPDLVLYQYSVDVSAGADGKAPTGKLLKRIFELLMEELAYQTSIDIATDYKSFLLTRSTSAIKEQYKEHPILYLSEGEDEPSTNARSYRVRLNFTRTLQMSDLIDYLTSSNASKLFESKETMIQAMNIILGHYPKTASNIVSLGANKRVGSNQHFDFDDKDVQTLEGGLMAARGLFVSVRAATSRLLLNVQVKHAAFYNPVLLAVLMSQYTKTNSSKVRLGIFLKKLRVRVTHINNKNKNGHVIPRFKTIFGLATPQDGRQLDNPPIVPGFGAGAKDVMFHCTSLAAPDISQRPAKPTNKKGKALGGGPVASQVTYISVYDFFRRFYNITIKDPELPVVNVGNRENPTYLPADVCHVVQGQPSSAKLTDLQTQQMVRFAVRGPAMNAESIIASGTRLLGLGTPTNTALNSFGVQIRPELITVQGLILESPPVKYRGGKSMTPKPDGSWNMINIQLAKGGEVEKNKSTWLSLSVKGRPKPMGDKEKILNTVDSFYAKMREVGIDVKDPIPGLEAELTGPNFDTEIDDVLKKFVSREGVEIELLLVILPSFDAPIYNSIKRGCDIKYGLRHVCVIASKFAKDNNHQYFANVALKVNLKLGGRNQYLEDSKVGIIAEGKTMVVGIDVTHPSPGSAKGAPSVAGIVASIDKQLGQWPADMQIQTPRQEMVEGLDGMMKSRLALWARQNAGSYPENILIYRDGVSEGQYRLILEEELPLLRKAYEETYSATSTKNGLPRMTIIVVGKRHHTRFYPIEGTDADNSSNPHHGTIVDRGVTEARGWDFYLQAHTALQGTARPAHNYIILDEIFRYRKVDPPHRNTADVVNSLTLNMSYLFGRATKPVSICPPAYYADLVCDRARRYLSAVFDASPEASIADGAGPASSVDAGAVRLHPKIKDTMFYI